MNSLCKYVQEDGVCGLFPSYGYGKPCYKLFGVPACKPLEPKVFTFRVQHPDSQEELIRAGFKMEAKLKELGHLMLNDVLYELGMCPIKDGYLYGWILKDKSVVQPIVIEENPIREEGLWEIQIKTMGKIWDML